MEYGDASGLSQFAKDRNCEAEMALHGYVDYTPADRNYHK
jgi:hypothetical protein